MNFTAKESEFLGNLLQSSTITEAIEKTGMSRAKAYELLNDDDFQEELKGYRRRNLAHITNRMNELSVRAVEVLEETLNDESASARTRSDIAKSIIDISLKLYQNEDIEERIKELEKLIGGNQ